MQNIYKAALEADPKLWVEIPKEDLTEELLLIAVNNCTVTAKELIGLGKISSSRQVLDAWIQNNYALTLEDAKWILDICPEYPKDVIIDRIEPSKMSMELLEYSPYEILCMKNHFDGWNEILAQLITDEEMVEVALHHDDNILKYCHSKDVGVAVLKECDKWWVGRVIRTIPPKNRSEEMYRLAFKKDPSLILDMKDERHFNNDVAKLVIEEADFSEETFDKKTAIMTRLEPYMDEGLIRLAFSKNLLTRRFLNENRRAVEIIATSNPNIAIEYLKPTEWNKEAQELASKIKQELVDRLIDDYEDCDDGDYRYILTEFVSKYKKYI
jgi:hypothetical protein